MNLVFSCCGRLVKWIIGYNKSFDMNEEEFIFVTKASIVESVIYAFKFSWITVLRS